MMAMRLAPARALARLVGTGGRIIATPSGPVELEVVDMLPLDDARRADYRALMLAIQCQSMAAAHDRDLERESEIYTDRLLDPQVSWRYNAAAFFRHEGRPVAFVHARARAFEHAGRTVDLHSMTTFVLPEWSRHGLVPAGFLNLCLRFAARHALSGRPGYYVGVCMTPVTYYFMHRRTRRMFPSPVYEAPRETHDLYHAVFDPITGPDGLVVEPRASFVPPRQQAWLAQTDDPFVRYYLERNPKFAEGYGLPVLVPVSGMEFVRGVTTSLKIELQRALRGRRTG